MDFDENRLYYSHQQLHASSSVATNPTTTEDGNPTNRMMMTLVEEEAPVAAMRRHFREFYRNYRLSTANQYLYRDRLLQWHRRKAGAIYVDLAHVGEYDPSLLGYILHQPGITMGVMEAAASDALQTVLYEMQPPTNNNHNNDPDDFQQDPNVNEETSAMDQQQKPPIHSIQILLRGNLQPTPLRSIQSQHMNKLLKCPGIVIATAPVKHRATQLVIRCTACSDTQTLALGNHQNSGMATNVPFPAQCRNQPNECPRYPYVAVPDESQFWDQQTLKLQEAPERVPTGEMPRSVLLAVERSLVDVAPPGTRVSVLCIPMLFTTASNKPQPQNNNNNNHGSKAVYLKVVGLQKEQNAHGSSSVTFTPAEEEAFRALSRRSDVYEILSRSIAPNIRGNYTVDVKKALVCQLFGGSRKKLSDRVRLRGDINILLLGDPSMAKSQFLKFVAKISPIGIYTSGKGSSAAGLTASVVRDRHGEFYLEGGAMVLADGGIVCIDEFDKMRPTDRVAIHEAMEQQTISIAKAGITTVLNSRSSVLAAANPVFGRYDELKSASENIDLMTTILSRFDMIFLVRDIREEERDRLICQHVMGVHMSGSGNATHNNNLFSSGGANDSTFQIASDNSDTTSSSPEAIAENVMRIATTGQGDLDVASYKKYIQYCKAKCSPRLTEEAGEVLTSSYVKIRDDLRKRHAIGGEDASSSQESVIPITVRQLEALVRISESLAKMRIDSEVRSEDVTEALRLFQVSTMAASAADQKDNGWMATTALSSSNREEMERTESFLRSRLTVGSLVNRQKLIEEAAGQGYNAFLVARALGIMASRGEALERNQGRLLKRIK